MRRTVRTYFSKNVRGKGGKLEWGEKAKRASENNKETCKIKEEKHCSGLVGKN